jgi:hypothetical protein
MGQGLTVLFITGGAGLGKYRLFTANFLARQKLNNFYKKCFQTVRVINPSVVYWKLDKRPTTQDKLIVDFRSKITLREDFVVSDFWLRI